MKLAVIIPAFNEEASIGEVIQSILKQMKTFVSRFFEQERRLN